jgi:uncharacterized membrane protein YoaK (UPF0700 family)
VRARVHRNRALVERAILAYLLPGIAGVINASGFFAVGTYTSHMTGMVARIGDELATNHLWLATRALLFVGTFIGGAMIATGLILYAQRRSRAYYWRPLLLESALLLVFATVNVGSEQGAHLNSLEMTALLCCAMGLQNALVTRLSGSVVRTTHLTGISTDIGIESMRALDGWWQTGRRPSLRRDPELGGLRRHLAIWISFLIGATVGPMLYLRIGHIVMLVPCALLLLLAAFDVWFGITAQSFIGESAESRQTSAS